MLLDPLSDLTSRPLRSVVQLLQEGVQTLFHLLLFSLLVLGFGGLLYTAVRSGGWLESVLGSIWDQHPTVAIVTLLAVLAGSIWGTRLFDRLPLFGRRGDMLVYCCLALGVFFAFKLVVTGSL
ncbi:MAG: hypothetical protein ACT4PQ_06720 [Betaproteobacteria bacterium]